MKAVKHKSIAAVAVLVSAFIKSWSPVIYVKFFVTYILIWGGIGGETRTGPVWRTPSNIRRKVEFDSAVWSAETDFVLFGRTKLGL